jgi:glycosyltransferase involved in cell wall biosynthesis
VFLEAAACGLPTVGTAVGLIDDAAPEAAVAVPVGDHATLANAALALLRDEGLRQHLGQRARDYARDHSADCTAARFEQLYLSLV